MAEQAKDASTAARSSRRAVGRAERGRLLAATLVGVLVTVFAVLNLDDVTVHWVITTGRTPLIVVVVVSFLLGIGVDRLLVLRAKRKRQP